MTTVSDSKLKTDQWLCPRWTRVCFLLAVAVHFYLVTINWTWGFMLGHEFRQAQTALITDYIDRQNNFGFYYETPILGKPWAFPLEFPFYQWAVVGVKRLLEIKDYEAARTVSLSCFYLALPAFYLLLGAAGVSPAKRWIFLALMVFCPVYIFYSRAFLIDPMAMMCSAWFLTAFVLMMQRRKWHWWVICTLAGTVGALIKSLVFLVWVFPAALYGAYCLWESLKKTPRGSQVVKTLLWGGSSVILPYTMLKWWVSFTDAIKAPHPSAYIFTSDALTQGNFGTFSLESRLSWVTWRDLWTRWAEAITFPWAIGAIVLIGVILCRRERHWILIFSGVWLFGQLAFPYAYAYQDYYFYAGAAFLVFVFGWVVTGVLELSWLPKWVRVGFALLPFAIQAESYHNYYYQMQKVQSNGGSALTRILKDVVPAESIISIIGQDWAAIIPYYSGHRALMIRKGMEFNETYIKGAIADLWDEEIAALIVSADSRYEKREVARVVKLAGLVPEPVFSLNDSMVYLSPNYHNIVRERLGIESNPYPELVLLAASDQDPSLSGDFDISEGASKLSFSTVSPRLERYKIAHGYRNFEVGPVPVYNFHADSDLWMRTPPNAQHFRWKYGLFDDAWDREGFKTDGVDFVIFAEKADGSRRELWRDVVNPAKIESDRGLQTGEGEFTLESEEQLIFASRERSNGAFDWAYFTSIEVW
jgi:hypothetical protein